MTSTSVMVTGGTATSISAVATAIQTNEIMQWISLALTIIGAIISFVVIPILNWWKDNKDKDTTVDDVIDLLENVKDGVDKVKNEIEEKEDKNDEDK